MFKYLKNDVYLNTEYKQEEAKRDMTSYKKLYEEEKAERLKAEKRVVELVREARVDGSECQKAIESIEGDADEKIIDIAKDVKEKLLHYSYSLEIAWETLWIEKMEIRNKEEAIKFLELMVDEYRPNQARMFFDRANLVIKNTIAAASARGT